MQGQITALNVVSTSLVTREEPARQRICVICQASSDVHLNLRVTRGDQVVCESYPITVRAGENNVPVLLPVASQEAQAQVRVTDANGKVVGECEFVWQAPREWTLYVIRSSHTDIGLHNSQYIQRQNCSRFLKKAMKLCDKTESWAKAEQYRYIMEGTWFWGNYCDDQGTEAARRMVADYVQAGKMDVGAATAGNHTQVFGLEEMCRSTYTRSRLLKDWNIDSRTMTMIDNNGMSWAMVAPYVDAGFRNIVFGPNQWNPLPSTIWPRNNDIAGGIWNTDASGGGARIDVRYDSALPMVFYWQGADEQSKLLVWGSTQYDWGGSAFGMRPEMKSSPTALAAIAERVTHTLTRLEMCCPYDVWLLACYSDDEEPNLNLNEVMRDWNQQWRWPEFRTVGDLDEPFERLREKFDAQIPVLRGDITGGWYQHPLTTPELLAQKFAVDRLLPTAEKVATLAGIFAPGYQYPAVEFSRAWDALLYNDEHSYGTSGYQGRRVYETWLQHRDWIDKAEATAQRECDRAWGELAKQISATDPALAVFNPTLQKRREPVTLDGADGQASRTVVAEIPAFGYSVIPLKTIPEDIATEIETPLAPPVVENQYYRLAFAADGSLSSIFDKELGRELLDSGAPFRGNQFVYTSDNHISFNTPQSAQFRIERNNRAITVTVLTEEPVSGAAIEQRVSLPEHEKRIDIDNRLSHVRDLINSKRYYRYGYYAFPFAVEQAIPYAHLNGCIATPGKDQTGHGTETYLAAREWCCVENGNFGVALLQLDSQLVEFGRIHPDKTDCFLPRPGSAIYSYLFNDWLQMHTPGGSHVNPRFRYTIVSYAGDFRSAGIPQLAERLANPVLCRTLQAQKGVLPAAGASFLETDCANLRLLALKRAEDGNGMILRTQESCGQPVAAAKIQQRMVPGGKLTVCTLDEQPKDDRNFSDRLTYNKHGYGTLRLEGADLVALAQTPEAVEPGRPAAIGSVYTGLVTEPRAACGEHQGHLYLEWGQNMEADLSHYELYRSEKPGFVPDSGTLVAEVEPGDYRVALYEERDLKTHTTYFYRVRAVNRTGACGEFSAEFQGITRE